MITEETKKKIEPPSSDSTFSRENLGKDFDSIKNNGFLKIKDGKGIFHIFFIFSCGIGFSRWARHASWI